MSDFHSDCKQKLVAAAGELFATPVARPRSKRLPRSKREPRSKRLPRPTREPSSWSKFARQRHIPLLAAIALGALLLAAAAFAATQIIGVGAPVSAPYERERSSVSTGIGIPVAGSRSAPVSARLLAMSVADPGGGLPWGMRIVRTTRGLECMQIGRLLDGRLGVLGEDGQFGDDRLFHELPVSVLEPSMCIQPNQRVVLSAGLQAAGALPGTTRSCVAPGERPTAASHPSSCPVGDDRVVAFGVLGPHAVSVSYSAGGHLHTVKTAGRYGAYLIVVRTPAKQVNVDALGGSSAPIDAFPIGTGPSDVISRLVFRFGSRLCQTGFNRQRGGPPQCTDSIARTPVFVPGIPRSLHTRVAARTRKLSNGYELGVTFRAPAAVFNASTAYEVEIALPHSRACGIPGGYGQSIERDVTRGQLVHAGMFVFQRHGCHGVVQGKVTLGPQTYARGDFELNAETIGRFSFRLP